MNVLNGRDDSVLPRLVFGELSECRHDEMFDVFRRQQSRNGDASFNGQKSNRIL